MCLIFDLPVVLENPKEVLMSITNLRKAELIKEFGKSEKDSGSAAVQVAILSERIRNLTEHLKTHKFQDEDLRIYKKRNRKHGNLSKHVAHCRCTKTHVTKIYSFILK